MSGVLLAVLSALAFGVSQVVVRIGLQYLKKVSSANLITLVSSLMTTLFIAIIFDFRSLVSISLLGFISFAIVGILNFPLARQFSYLGTKSIGVTRSYPLTASYPLFAMSMAAVFLGERVTPIQVLGALSIIGGISLLAREMEQGQDSEIKGSRWQGFIYSLAAALFYGAGMLVTRWASALTTPLAGATFSLLVGTLVHFLISSRDFERAQSVKMKALLPLLLCGFLSALGVISLFAALSRNSVAVVTSLTATSPLITLLLATVVLRRWEKITPLVVAGALLVVLGSVLVTLFRH